MTKIRTAQLQKTFICNARSDTRSHLIFVCMVLVGLFMQAPVPAAAGFKGESYAYNLANFNGTILSQWANVYVDREREETYVIDSRTRDVRIFDKNGMEVFIFGDDGGLGYIVDLTVDNDGNIILLSKRRGEAVDMVRCNYRGQPISTINLANLPSGFASFRPNRIAHREGRLYLLDTTLLRIAVTDTNGVFDRAYDIAPLLKIADSKRGENEVTGFSVDRHGNILFTIAIAFRAYRLSPDGTIDSFGKGGGGAGAFGVVSGITSDKEGYIYVTDKLRCVVLVFDDTFRFLKEFGYRGDRPENLVVPNDIDADDSGRVYVSQGGSRGISVFRMVFTND